jgi:hypothetical protein
MFGREVIEGKQLRSRIDDLGDGLGVRPDRHGASGTSCYRRGRTGKKRGRPSAGRRIAFFVSLRVGTELLTHPLKTHQEITTLNSCP